MKQRTAFTIVELLVVVAIVAVMISLLLPALSKAREAASDTQCVSNLRVLGQAAMAYSTKYNGYVIQPTPTSYGNYNHSWATWMGRDFLMQSYGHHEDAESTAYGNRKPTTDIFTCMTDGYSAGRDFFEGNGKGMSFGLNWEAARRLDNSARPLTSIRTASATLLFSEKRGDSGMIVLRASGQPFPALYNAMDPRHGNGTSLNICFVDGHVARESIQRVRAYMATRNLWVTDPLWRPQ